ncbi:Rpn family recombination-promoting nuclease/putative transposase [Brevibacillus dissolubilis]|uniref:Rpn family recombination-promoting nuclease/putative transposase n=1 Tax=Brevibacillus dissolubilis TaxID=1844116 RepID=UPI001116862F|nr:Rpn family recombination-promoting nuclease/putative transposase [Brevibacillus dissolubilis]
MTKLMNPKVDFVFKRIFGAEENKDILLSLLNAILQLPDDRQITEIVLLNPHLEPDMLGDKQSVLDVRVLTADGVHINIEIQLFNPYNIEKRTLYYWAKMYEGQLQQRDNYKKLKKTITINIVDFNCLKSESYHSVFHVCEDTSGTLLTDDLEIHFLELKKLRSASVTDDSMLVKWLQFLAAEHDEIREELAMTDPTIKKAFDVLEYLSHDKIERIRSEMREKALRDEISRVSGAEEEGFNRGMERGMEQGLERGLEQGLEQGLERGLERGLEQGMERGLAEGIERGIAEGAAASMRKIALTMLAKGTDIPLISEVTGLSPEEITQLQKQLPDDTK